MFSFCSHLGAVLPNRCSIVISSNLLSAPIFFVHNLALLQFLKCIPPQLLNRLNLVLPSMFSPSLLALNEFRIFQTLCEWNFKSSLQFSSVLKASAGMVVPVPAPAEPLHHLQAHWQLLVFSATSQLSTAPASVNQGLNLGPRHHPCGVVPVPALAKSFLHLQGHCWLWAFLVLLCFTLCTSVVLLWTSLWPPTPTLLLCLSTPLTKITVHAGTIPDSTCVQADCPQHSRAKHWQKN